MQDRTGLAVALPTSIEVTGQDGAEGDSGQSALIQLRAFLSQRELPPGTRLPPERELAESLGASRGELRKALALLERRGELWRHVGKGTFVGARPIAERVSVAEIAALCNPADVMRARLAIEPELAREAALHAKADDIGAMAACADGARSAGTWRQYESWDNRLHRAIAEASQNALLLAVFDTVNAIRRTVVWGRPRDEAPHVDHHSFAEHDAIVAAIRERDLAGAAAAMRRHLRHVEMLLLSRPEAE